MNIRLVRSSSLVHYNNIILPQWFFAIVSPTYFSHTVVSVPWILPRIRGHLNSWIRFNTSFLSLEERNFRGLRVEKTSTKLRGLVRVITVQEVPWKLWQKYISNRTFDLCTVLAEGTSSVMTEGMRKNIGGLHNFLYANKLLNQADFCLRTNNL